MARIALRRERKICSFHRVTVLVYSLIPGYKKWGEGLLFLNIYINLVTIEFQYLAEKGPRRFPSRGERITDTGDTAGEEKMQSRERFFSVVPRNWTFVVSPHRTESHSTSYLPLTFAFPSSFILNGRMSFNASVSACVTLAYVLVCANHRLFSLASASP